MTDLRLVQSGDGLLEAVTFDLLLTPLGDFDTSQELATAMIVMLGTDRRAADDAVLPIPGDDDRRGWWADYEAREVWDAGPIGCDLWLLSRAKILPPGAREGATAVRIEDSISTATIDTFIAPGIASDFAVTVERVGLERMSATLTLYRGATVLFERRFDDLWSSITKA